MYAGVDPTAPSLHVGHMLPFMVLAWGYVWGLPVTWVVSILLPSFRDVCLIRNSLVAPHPASVTQQDV